MYSISTETQQYETYILTDSDRQARLEVVPERGGIITRWQVQDKELLYLDEERFAKPEMTVRGGIPILFPICGNLPDGTYTYEGKTYALKQHGFARNLPWAIATQSTTDGASLSLKLTSTDETRSVYPFDFELLFTYQLKGNSLTLIQRHTNHSAVAMPFCTGLHPYFTVSDKSQLQFEIPATSLYDHITQEKAEFSGRFDMEQDEIDVAFPDLSAASAAVGDRQQHTTLRLDYDSAYPVLVFWTIKGKDYYCLEPWSAPRNAMNTGNHLMHLEPGKSLESRVSFSVEV
ncbi:MAG: hypothetical protein WBA57_06600 [Elainellaceae cyanobacterium]